MTFHSEILEPAIRSEEVDSPLLRVGLSFTSFYLYSPRATGWVAEASRRICHRVKQGHVLWLPRYVGRVYRASVRDQQLALLFDRGAVLVPVPGSAASSIATTWPALQLAVALKDVGFALPVQPILRRQVTVRKSSTAPIAARPSVREHYASFGVTASFVGFERIVLVDDVVTKGRTLLAAAARLHERLPHADIRAFALIRTLGFAPCMDHLIEPSHGCIRWLAGDAFREP